jgi:phosphoglycolate phosphatase
MQPALLIFDLDGTLIDSQRDLATAVNLVRGHYGLAPLPVSTVSGYIGDGVRALLQRALAGAAFDLEEAVGLQKRFYREHLHDETALYPGVAAGLRRLHTQGHCLAVATNKPVEMSDLILSHFGLRELFTYVGGDGNAARLKPDPAMILNAMRQTGIGSDRTWVIGDNATDLESARRAGARSIFVTYGIGSAGGQIPDVTCATFDELVRRFI